MPERKNDSPSGDSADLVASLLGRIDDLIARISARDEHIDELLALVKVQNVRIAELEAKCGGPPKTPDNSSVPPSRGQKANAEPPTGKRRCKGRPGVARKLAENPDATRRFYAERCPCGAALSENGQECAKEYDHTADQAGHDALFRAACPCCKARVVTKARPADMQSLQNTTNWSRPSSRTVAFCMRRPQPTDPATGKRISRSNPESEWMTAAAAQLFDAVESAVVKPDCVFAATRGGLGLGRPEHGGMLAWSAAQTISLFAGAPAPDCCHSGMRHTPPYGGGLRRPKDSRGRGRRRWR
jgi:DNA-directed RNA polymerase subunit RPC12/RpoP